MIAVNDMGLKWESVIFGEPTEGKIGLGHKGHFVFELFAHGVAAHSGYPERGRSANATMVSLINDLQMTELPSSSLLGSSTFHCGKIDGGVAYNVLSANCYALCAVRVSADLDGIEKQVKEMVAKYPSVKFNKRFGYSETLLDHDIDGRAPSMRS